MVDYLKLSVQLKHDLELDLQANTHGPRVSDTSIHPAKIADYGIGNVLI